MAVNSVDKAALLEWLGQRAQTEGSVVGAVYDGLIARVKRGDFDTREAFAGYFIAAAEKPESEPSMWDGGVHATEEEARKSVDAITQQPDRYPSEVREHWAVYGLTKLERKS